MENFVLWGTIVNALCVFGGALIGSAILLFSRRKKDAASDAHENGHQTVLNTIFQGLGLCVMLVGIDGAIQGSVNDRILAAFSFAGIENPGISGENILVVILSVVLGALCGSLLNLDGAVMRLGEWIERKLKGRVGNVAQGFVSATLLFCVGSMAVMGPLNSGLLHDHTMLYTKTTIDAISAIVFATTMGIGVGLSAVSIFLYQGIIALLAQWIAPLLSAAVISAMSITGSLLIMAVGLNMIGVTKLKVMNYLPAVFFPIGLVPLMNFLL